MIPNQKQNTAGKYDLQCLFTLDIQKKKYYLYVRDKDYTI